MDTQSEISNRPEPQSLAPDPGGANRALRSTPPHRAFGIYLLLAVTWGYAIHYFGREFTIRPPWIVFVGVVLFSVPVVLSSLYLNTARKIRDLAAYDLRGRWYRFFSGRVLATFFWSTWSVVTTFFVLLQFHTYSAWEWAGFFLVVPLFWLIYQIVRSSIAAEMKPYLVSSTAIRVARRITPIAAVVAYLAVIYLFGDVPEHDSLGSAIDYARSHAGQPTGSALVFELAQFQAYYDGAKYFVIGQIQGEGAIWAMLTMGVGGYVIFFSACAMLSCFVIPLTEYRRVFSPLSDAAVPTPVTRWNIGLTTAIFSFVIGFIFLPSFTSVEQVTRNDNRPFEEARQQVDVFVLAIDDQYFRLTTRNELHEVQTRIIRKMDSALPDLEKELDSAFGAMEANVDSFLDWYYSLSAEYLRTTNLLAGNIEPFLAKTLDEYLQRGEPFKDFEAKVAEVLRLQKDLQVELAREIEIVLANNRIEPPSGANIVVMQRINMSEIANLPQHKDMVEIEKRLGMTGGAGLIGAVVVKKIVAKITAKGTIKAAGTAIAKAAGGKFLAGAGGMAGGAGIGGAIGTFLVPGPGTAIGAFIGGVLGAIGAGLAVDKGLLMLEEQFGRDEFKEDLLTAIRETRATFEAGLRN